MSERPCPACGRTLRHGVRALLLSGDKSRSAIVCKRCKSGGVVLVAQSAPIVIKKPREVDAELVVELVRQCVQQIDKLATLAQRSAVAAPHPTYAAWHMDGRAEGLQAAADILRKRLDLSKGESS